MVGYLSKTWFLAGPSLYSANYLLRKEADRHPEVSYPADIQIIIPIITTIMNSITTTVIIATMITGIIISMHQRRMRLICGSPCPERLGSILRFFNLRAARRLRIQCVGCRVGFWV